MSDSVISPDASPDEDGSDVQRPPRPGAQLDQNPGENEDDDDNDSYLSL